MDKSEKLKALDAAVAQIEKQQGSYYKYRNYSYRLYKP